MALIKQSSLGTLTKQAIVLDLGDLQRQAGDMLEHARKTAAGIVAEGEAERQRLIAGAAELGREAGHREGFEIGRRQGTEQGRSEVVVNLSPMIAELTSKWSAALDEYAAARQAMVQASERDVVKLAVLIAGRVVKRQIALDPTVVVDQLRAVLGVVIRPTELVVAINPEDRPLVELALPELLGKFFSVRRAEVVDDLTLARGSCTARMRGGDGSGQAGNGDGPAGEIDASISTQLDRLVAELLPGAPAYSASTTP